MKDYPVSVLQKLSALIKDQEGAQQWLIDNGYQELAEFWDAYEDVEKSFQWLKNNGYVHFAALVDAMSGNSKAKMWLVQNGYRNLAAFSDASEGNKTAVTFLLRTDDKKWLDPAKAIYDYNQKKQKKSFWNIFNFGNPYS